MAKTILRNYQRQVVKRACENDQFAFAMEMGTGKTLCVIEMAKRRKFKSVVVFCPSSLKQNWREELAKHADQMYDVFLLDSNDTQRRALPKHDWREGAQRWVIVGTDSVGASTKTANTILTYMQSNPSALVIDESHFIKSPKSNRTKVLMKLASLAPWRYIMSGTITTGYLNDIFCQYNWLKQGCTGHNSYYSFIGEYCVLRDVVTQGGFVVKTVIGSKNKERLVAKLAPFTESIQIKDVVEELPDKTYRTIKLEMPIEVREKYESFTSNVLNIADLMRQAQISGGFLDEFDEGVKSLIGGGDCKAKQVKDLVDAASGQVVIWARFRAEMKYLHAMFNKERKGQAQLLFGDTPIDARQAMVNSFQNGEFKILIANPSVGGTGFNLTAANLAIFYSNSFNYSDRAQAEARLHRMGQKHPVVIVDLIYEDSIDEKILEALMRKEDLLTYLKHEFQFDHEEARV